MKKFYVKKEKKQKNNRVISDKKALLSLVQAKSHFGSLKKEVRPENKNVIYGTRFNQTILNLNYTIQSIKRVLSLVDAICRLKTNRDTKAHKILVICNKEQTRFMTYKALPKTNFIEYVHADWVSGFLTNPPLLKEQLKHIRLIISFNTIRGDLLSKGAIKMKLPLVSVTNTHIRSNNINYPIFINTNSPQSLFFIIYLFNLQLKNYETK